MNFKNAFTLMLFLFSAIYVAPIYGVVFTPAGIVFGALVMAIAVMMQRETPLTPSVPTEPKPPKPKRPMTVQDIVDSMKIPDSPTEIEYPTPPKSAGYIIQTFDSTGLYLRKNEEYITRRSTSPEAIEELKKIAAKHWHQLHTPKIRIEIGE